jgi:hypothetical protein
MEYFSSDIRTAQCYSTNKQLSVYMDGKKKRLRFPERDYQFIIKLETHIKTYMMCVCTCVYTLSRRV